MIRNWYSNLSLRTKAIGLSVAITTLALSVVAAVGVLQLRRQIAAEQHRSADSMALGFAHASELAAAVHDVGELSRLAASFLRDENVLFIAAYGKGPQPIATAVRDAPAWDLYQRGLPNPSHCAVGTHLLEPMASSSNEFSEEATADPLSVPAADAGKAAGREPRILGYVVVGLSTRAGQEALQEQSHLTIMTTLVAAMGGALILSVTLGGWMRRLAQVAQASHQISQGDFSTTLTDDRKDEIGTLSRSFESMRVALQERDATLRGFTDTLQEQVKQRTQDLETALAAAEQASRTKSLFLANMSHELRTPLNGVIGMVDLLLATDPNIQQKRYCEVAKSSARSLLELINDILDFSKIEAGKLELDCSDFDLHESIESVVQMLGDRADKKKLTLACSVAGDVPRIVGGDTTRFRQVILNLTTNAIKFTDHGEVVVSAILESQSPTHAVVRIKVRDSGIGIPPDRVARLFQSFSQVDASTTRKYGGTGLGLAISQRIVDLLGGQIGVESAEGNGSTFWFTARFETRVQQPAAARDAKVDPRGMRVLAVDDNVVNREILHAQLASWSLRPDVACGSQEALCMLQAAAARGEPYRFAILDMHMPNMDGSELARRIKSDPATRDVILISLSSLSDILSPQAMSARGFSACLSKPALPSQLYDAIVNSLAATEPSRLPAAPLLDPDSPPPLLTGVRVLLAEDNEVNRLVASELLAQAGCVVTMAVNGREAVDQALAGSFDVILMDCQMPILDGFEATRMIRGIEKVNPGQKRRPIIALTANAIKGDRELCLSAGMDDYVTKPIEPVTLMETIRTFIPADRLAAAKAAKGDGLPQQDAVQANDAEKPPAPIPAAPPAAGPAAPADASASPPIDVVSLQRRCMGNRKIAAKALSKFDSSMPAEFEALAQCVRTGDAKAGAALAHKIKGAAANVSAEGLRRIAAEFDLMLKAAELSQAQASLDRFQEEMDRFRKYLATALGELTPADGVANGAAQSAGT